MPELETAIPTGRSRGNHNFKVIIGTGTAVLQYSVENEAFGDVPNTTVSASTGLNVKLPACRVQAVLTGDAQAWITDVERG